MSRGGRGGARGGRKTGPDMSWQDEDLTDSPQPLKRVPGPMFPERYIPMPKPLSTTETAQIRTFLKIRERIRNGPLYTVLEPSSLLDANGKINPRAGFDPFNDQERFTKRYHRKRRVVPDLSERGGYTLKLFPVELWPVLDPKKRQKDYWNGLSEEARSKLNAGKGVKRKRGKLAFDNEEDDLSRAAGGKASGSETEEDDIIDRSKRRKKGTGKIKRGDTGRTTGREKKGLDAEDDYPDVEQQDDDGDEAGAGGDEDPQDSEFGSDEDDDVHDDYNAENYFDDGADDDAADVDDDDGGGGGGGGGDYY